MKSRPTLRRLIPLAPALATSLWTLRVPVLTGIVLALGLGAIKSPLWKLVPVLGLGLGYWGVVQIAFERSLFFCHGRPSKL